MKEPSNCQLVHRERFIALGIKGNICTQIFRLSRLDIKDNPDALKLHTEALKQILQLQTDVSALIATIEQLETSLRKR